MPFPSIWYSPLGLETSNSVVIARGMSPKEKYLEIFSNDSWHKKMKLIESFPEGELKNKFVRWYIATAETVELDNHNRIRLPKQLTDYCEIIKEVALVGSIETIQIWPKEVIDATENVTEGDFAMIFDFMNQARGGKENGE
jgi:division/cell wall cluster transcriptional repressor MraZ